MPPHIVQPERGEGLVEVHLEPCALLRQGGGLLRVAHGGAHEQGVVAPGAEAGGLPGKKGEKTVNNGKDISMADQTEINFFPS